MTSFSTFLKTHTTTSDKHFVGDLASEVKADKNFPRQGTLQDVYNHLNNLGVAENRLEALYYAYQKYCDLYDVEPDYTNTPWSKRKIKNKTIR